MPPRKKKQRAHGSGSVYQQKGRATWSIKWHENGVTKYHHGLPSKELGEKTLKRIHGEIVQERVGLPADPKDAESLNGHAERWLEGRRASHRSAYEDSNRWENHFEPGIGRLKPDQVDVPTLKTFIAAKGKEGLSSTTINLLIRLLSSLYGDLVEDGHAKLNPCRQLSKKTRHKLLKPAHDPQKTPHLGSVAEVLAVHEALKAWPSIATAYAVGALAGLRTGEVRALQWSGVNLGTGDIHVTVQVERRRGKDPATWNPEGTQTTKDDDGRKVPIQPALAPILAAAKLATGGKGLVCPPIRVREGGHLSDRTMSSALRKVLVTEKLDRPGLGWYEATRHTFASLFILSGGTMEDLQRMLGHSTLLVTMRYAHLRPGHYSESARGRLTSANG